MSEKLSAHEERMLKVKEYCLTKLPISPYSSTDFKKEIASYCKISSMAVGDLIKDAADADLIHSEKIGISSHYWMFPAEETSIVKKKNADLSAKKKALLKEIDELNRAIEHEESARLESTERTELLAKLKEQQQTKKSNAKMIEAYKENDPVEFSKFKESLEISRNNANRWTDNIYAVLGYIKKQTGMRQKEVMKTLGISEDMDYLE